MWQDKKVWQHYLKNILATDRASAGFLASYLHYTGITRKYVHALEIIDLQKYKIISKPGKVQASLRERTNVPFVFVACKN